MRNDEDMKTKSFEKRGITSVSIDIDGYVRRGKLGMEKLLKSMNKPMLHETRFISIRESKWKFSVIKLRKPNLIQWKLR